jgi:hypothetical protein
MRKVFLLAAAVFLTFSAYSQATPEVIDTASVVPEPINERVQGIQKRKALEAASLVKNLKFTGIGPTIMSGRVTDLEVNPKDPSKFYVAYASGGLWYTDNNGQSFKPLFDSEDVITIGDIAVDWSNNTIWIGTGEVNSSRSSYAGIGVYKSEDGGKNWIYCGLPESQHIGRIVVNPRNPLNVYVAVLGHLYTPNAERGVYKTLDGGKTWKQTLFIDEYTGAVDLLIDPNVPDFLYVTTWHRERTAWNFVEGGSTSDIYKSVDAGETWQLLTSGTSGFPSGNIGRIGIAVAPLHNNIVYAVVDNQNPIDQNPAERERNLDTSDFNLDSLKIITAAKFATLDDVALAKFLKDNKFPENYTAATIKAKVASGEFAPTVLTDYLNDGGYVFNLPIKGCEVYRSDDGGTSWYKTHEGPMNGAFFTYGYYFATIKVSPKNDNKILVSAFNALLSEDGGKTFKNIDKENVHPDHHAAYFNPANDKHIIVGNDGGVNITYDNGANWFLANNPAVGQFYSVALDNATPYNVYGGLQDNGVWWGPSDYEKNNYWQAGGKYPYQPLYGGDGMQVQVDTRDNATVYTGYQFGYYARLNNASGREELSIRPTHAFGEQPLRYNWQTPILLSKHNQDILYYGSNRMHRSLNKGANMVALSGDLTNGKVTGDVPYGTITTIAESPTRFGLLYCGTDDGNVWISKDGGYEWTKINVFIKKELPPVKSKTPPPVFNAVPAGLWVSRVTASAFNEGTVYVSLNGYRYDNFLPYLYVSTDYGATWSEIGKDLPSEPINVVKEDPKNPNILYVGTDNGLYVSINAGKTFMAFNGGLPRVAVHDIAIQERDNEMVIATHGRSLYKVSLNEIQALDFISSKDLHVFAQEKYNYDENTGKKFSSFDDAYEPTYQLAYYVKNAGITTITIATPDGTIINEFTDNSEQGLNYIDYALTFDAKYKAAYEEYLNGLPVDGYREVANIKQADNKKYYLLPGKFIIKFATESLTNAQENFEIINP